MVVALKRAKTHKRTRGQPPHFTPPRKKIFSVFYGIKRKFAPPTPPPLARMDRGQKKS